MYKRVRSFACIVAVGSLGACTTAIDKKPGMTALQGDVAVTTHAGLAETYIRNPGSSFRVCKAGGPDATLDLGNEVSLGISVVDIGSDRVGDSSGQNDVEMSGRTPALLMTRELFYRTCEFSTNYNLTKDEAQALFEKAMDASIAGWMAEIAQTTITINDSETNNVAPLSVAPLDSGTADPSPGDLTEEEDENENENGEDEEDD